MGDRPGIKSKVRLAFLMLVMLSKFSCPDVTNSEEMVHGSSAAIMERVNITNLGNKGHP